MTTITHIKDLGFIKKYKLSDGREVTESELQQLGISIPGPPELPTASGTQINAITRPKSNPTPPDQDTYYSASGLDTSFLTNPVTKVPSAAATMVAGLDDFAEFDTFTPTPTRVSSIELGASGQGAISDSDRDFDDYDAAIAAAGDRNAAANVDDFGDYDAAVAVAKTAANVQKAQGQRTSAKGQSAHAGLTSNKNIIINPRTNQLSDFASFTYNVELFMLSPKKYVHLLQNPLSVSTILANFAVPIIRSGGIGKDGGEYFDIDFYIDNIKLTNIAASPNNKSSNTNAIDISFDITEPNGVTLLERLKDAAKNAMEAEENYLATPYIMRITFRGYDDVGREIVGAIKPKHIPIKIIQLSFNVTESGSIYKAKAIPYHYDIFGSVKNTIPINVQVSAGTVQNIFQGAASIKDKVITESKRVDDTADEDEEQQWKTVTTTKNIFGEPHTTLENAMNEFYKKKTKPFKNKKGETIPGSSTIADKVSFKFAPEIANAKVQTERFDALNTPQASKKAYKSIAGLVKGKIAVDKDNNLFKINAGTSINALLNYVIVSSDYLNYNINDAEKILADKGDKNTDGLAWFKIIPEIKEFLGWDSKEARYKFHVEYTVIVTRAHYEDFPWAPKVLPKGRGFHKKYDYIFSGQNTEVQNIRLDFDLAYYDKRSLGTGTPEADKDISNVHAQIKDVSGQIQQVINDDNVTSKRKKDFFSSIMHDGADLIQMDLDILGDPAFFPTGDALFQPQGNNGAVYNDPFLPDGTINYDLTPPYIQINLKTPSDYDPTSGYMDISTAGKYSSNEFNGIYKVISVRSVFSGGTFTQELNAIRTKMQPINGKIGRSKESIANTERRNEFFAAASSIFQLFSSGNPFAHLAKTGVTSLTTVENQVDSFAAFTGSRGSAEERAVDDFGAFTGSRGPSESVAVDDFVELQQIDQVDTFEEAAIDTQRRTDITNIFT